MLFIVMSRAPRDTQGTGEKLEPLLFTLLTNEYKIHFGLIYSEKKTFFVQKD